MTEQEIIANAAACLVRRAADLGYNLIIERQPAQPLAMGNTRSCVSVWPLRHTAQLYADAPQTPSMRVQG